MRKKLSAALVTSALSTAALAGPKEDAYAAVQHWVAAYNRANVDEVTGLYAPDAVFWGTTMQTLATTPEAVRAYFSNVKPGGRITLGDHAAVVLSDGTVVDAGRYDVTRNDMTTPARYTFVPVQRDGNWMIVHHHSSALPKPPQ